jgi:hypothetical protein
VTAAEVRALVKEALAPHLGRYLTQDGTQLPALTLTPATPPGYRMDGTFRRHLEACVHPSPELTPQGLYGGSLVTRAWRVVIKDWGPIVAPTSDAAGVAIACEELMARLDITSCVIVPATDETLEQGTCLLRDFGTTYQA